MTDLYQTTFDQPKPIQGKLKYKPLPQTSRHELAGLFRVEYRTVSMVAHAKRQPNEGWHEIIGKPVLTLEQAESKIRNEKAHPKYGGWFEHRMIPVDKAGVPLPDQPKPLVR